MTTDPRIYFASERTLLSWVRTGISILGVGFLVAKFGLFLRLMGYQGWMIGHQHVSMLVGVAFALIGSGSIGWAAWQHHRFAATLPADQRPLAYSMRSSVGIAVLLAVMGVLLSSYLAVSSQVTPITPPKSPAKLPEIGERLKHPVRLSALYRPIPRNA